MSHFYLNWAPCGLVILEHGPNVCTEADQELWKKQAFGDLKQITARQVYYPALCWQGMLKCLESVGRSVSQSVGQTVGWSVSRSVGLSDNHSVGRSISQSEVQSVSWSVGRSARLDCVCLSVHLSDYVCLSFQVEYDSIGFLEKNRDTLPSSVTEVLQKSDNELISTIFSGKYHSFPKHWSEFKDSLYPWG